MSIDPKLQALFLQARQAVDRDAFVRDVMARIDRERRRTLLVWAGLIVVALAVLTALSGPVFAAVGMATQLLPVSLVEIEADWLRLLVAPINSVAAVIAVGILLLRKFFRRIF